MNEKILKIKNGASDSWKKSTNQQKMLIIGGFLFLVIVISALSLFANQSNLTPLYSNLTPQETGQIKEQLDGRGVESEIVDGGTSILVPAEQVENLTVELAAQGIPQGKDVDYSFFSENTGFGMTDNEFDMLKVEAMQTELANLIKGINGITDAKVMLNLPEKSVWMSDTSQEASASIVINQQYGHQISQEQIKGLYELISRSVPNLPTDNIVITNQLFETFSYNDEQNSGLSQLNSQFEVKKEIEKDLQQQVQSMLATVMGPDKVRVLVTTDIDFTQEQREENRVEPVIVNGEEKDGLALSVENIEESYTGNQPEGAEVGTGQPDVANEGVTYQEDGNQNGDYERTEERINNEVNRIRKNIVEAPYKIRDLGLQVIVAPPGEEEELPNEIREDIENILSSIIRTTIQDQQQLTDEEIEGKITVSAQPFSDEIQGTDSTDTEGSSIKPWVLIVIGVSILLLVILIIVILKKKKKVREQQQLEEMAMQQMKQNHKKQLEDIEFSADPIINQLSKMSKKQPEEVVKLIRTWMNEPKE